MFPRPEHANLSDVGDEAIPDINFTNDEIYKINGVPNITKFDGTFISLRLVAIFGVDTLMISSAEGNLCRLNGKVHVALDPVKLKFIKGNLSHIGTHYSCIITALITCCCFFPI